MRVHPSPAGMKTMLPLVEAERMSHFLGKDDASVKVHVITNLLAASLPSF